MKPSIHIRTAGASDVACVGALCTNGPTDGSATRGKKLTDLSRAGCLLKAQSRGRLLGAVGLEPTRGAITGPWTAVKTLPPDLVPRLVAAAERLAVQYGITRVWAKPDERIAGIMADLGYRPDGRGSLSRSILRRSTRYSRRAREIASDLGIPANYGASRLLRLQPEASALDSIGEDIYGRDQNMLPRAAEAWRAMALSAKRDGIEIQPVSAFRSVDYQAGLVRRKLNAGQSIDAILAVSAAPGYSEHHSGRAIDVTTPGCEVLEEPFEITEAFRWLQANAGRFGFTLSYPRDNPHGVAYEPWHWAFLE